MIDTEFITRDLHAYTTAKERAAYRAGMGSAAAICDAVARQAEESNRARGRITQAGVAMAAVATDCADRIWAEREKIGREDLPGGGSHG